MTTEERRNALRDALSDWKVWMGIAYFGLVLVIVALWVGYGRLSTEQIQTSQIAAERHADIVANADAQYQQCVASIPQLTKINRFIQGVQDEHATLPRNSIASHRATPKDSGLWRAQIANITRLRRASREVAHVRFTVPTAKSCVELRRHLLTGSSELPTTGRTNR